MTKRPIRSQAEASLDALPKALEENRRLTALVAELETKRKEHKEELARLHEERRRDQVELVSLRAHHLQDVEAIRVQAIEIEKLRAIVQGLSYCFEVDDDGPDVLEARALLSGVKPDRTRLIEQLVQRFLGWRLPESFAPDAGISFTKPKIPKWWPVGTNLFTADEAKAMIEYLFT